MEFIGLAILTFIILGFITIIRGAFNFVKALVLPAVVIAFFFFMFRSKADDKDAVKHHKVSWKMLFSGAVLLSIGLLRMKSEKTGYYDLSGNLCIGGSSSLSVAILLLGFVLLLIGVMCTVYGYLTFGKDERLSESEIESHKKMLVKAALVSGATLTAVVLIYAVKRIGSDSEQVKIYQEQIVGQTYSDIKQNVFFPGDKIDRAVVKIVDDGTLEYGSGKSTVIYNKTKLRFDDDFTWITCPYELRFSFTGHLIICFNGHSYPARFNVSDGSFVGFVLF